MMSGYQFARIQTYSLKGNSANRSAVSVLSENSRVAGSANHVKNPKPPRLLYGIDPIEIAPIIEQRIADAKAGLRGTGQRIQSMLKIDLEALQRVHSDFKREAMETISSIRDRADHEIAELQAELSRYKNNDNALKM